MKKLVILFTIIFNVQAYAMDLECKSAKYTVKVTDIAGDNPVANYGINGKMNDGADVALGQVYLSDKVIALSLNVDGVMEKFEVAAVSINGAKTFSGYILTGKTSQKAICKLL